MRISDWSSDVCSSDLPVMGDGAFRPLAGTDGHFLAVVRRPGKRRIDLSGRGHGDARDDCQIAALYAVARELGGAAFMRGIRSEERRVAKECVSMCSSRGVPSL